MGKKGAEKREEEIGEGGGARMVKIGQNWVGYREGRPGGARKRGTYLGDVLGQCS